MKLLILLALIHFSLFGYSQSAFSLVDYTPKFSFQTGSNCYAYATVYMALSTQLAFEKKLKNPGDTFALSYDFADNLLSYMKRTEKNFYPNVARDLYNTESTSDLGDLDCTFYILHKYGTKRFYKYKSEPISSTSANDTDLVKFSKPKEIFNPYRDKMNENKLSEFKNYIRAGSPIIICINQPQPSCNRWKIDHVVKSKVAHIVTIIGYENDSLLIQNNYGAEDCRYYYSLKEVSNILQWAYVYEQF